MYETRRDRLKLLLEEISAAELSRRSGIHQTRFSHYKTGEKHMSEATARKIETAARKPERWLDVQHSPEGNDHRFRPVAQVMSPPFVSDALPLLLWETIMKQPTPDVFRAVLPDDAMGPDLPRGTEVVWSRLRRRIPGRVVLIRDGHGQVHARRCQQGREPGSWLAAPSNPDYVTFAGHEVELLAVFKGRLEADDK